MPVQYTLWHAGASYRGTLPLSYIVHTVQDPWRSGFADFLPFVTSFLGLSDMHSSSYSRASIKALVAEQDYCIGLNANFVCV